MEEMSDRELLELAAKAIGHDLHINRAEAPQLWKGGEYVRFWNPLSDDGDALRLAVKLRMEIDHNHPADEQMWVSVRAANQRFSEVEEIDGEAQREVATRRAIVRAAAEIGRQMKEGDA